MSCDCAKNYKEQLKERAKSMKKFEGLDPDITESNTAFIFEDGGKVSSGHYTEFVAEAMYHTSSGKVRTKKEKFNVVHIYCPYCGKKYKED